MTEKTHYRKVFNSPYLSSADIVGPTILTIARVVQEIDKTKRSKEFFNTAYFVERDIRPGEPLKPMILNAGNCNIVVGFTGSKYVEDWSNVPVTIYVDPAVKLMGETVGGLCISPEKPQERKVLTPDMTKVWDRAVASYAQNDNLDAVLDRYDISDEHQAKIKKESES